MGSVSVRELIPADPSVVWAVLSDLAGWETWNAIMVDGRCDGGRGSRLTVRVDTGLVWVPVKSTAWTWEPERSLSWGEDRGWVLRIEHGFRLEPHAEGTVVEHYEHFNGVLGRLLLPPIRGRLTANYQAFLTAMKARVLQEL